MPSYIIGTIDISRYELTGDLNYLNSVKKQPEEYDEFGQGYWKNLSLFNATGVAEDSQYRNSQSCLPTGHMEHCSSVAKLIYDNFDFTHMKMVRARNLVDGMVIPHRDFVELDKSIHYFRVFVPLENNKQSFHSDENGVFQMRPGEVWFLDAAINHAAINFASQSRMFLCLDFIFEDDFRDTQIFRAHAKVDTSPSRDVYVQRKPMDESLRTTIVDAISKVISPSTFKDLLFLVSKYHFNYQLPVAACYDWLVEAADLAGDSVVLEKAMAIKRYLIEQRAMGERLLINSWDH